jgi:hypothetical protein
VSDATAFLTDRRELDDTLRDELYPAYEAEHSTNRTMWNPTSFAEDVLDTAQAGRSGEPPALKAAEGLGAPGRQYFDNRVFARQSPIVAPLIVYICKW